MIEVLCQCDWGLGVQLPPHGHMTLTLVRLPNQRTLWVNNHIPNRHVEELTTVEELRFTVNWKALYRPEIPKTWEFTI